MSAGIKMKVISDGELTIDLTLFYLLLKVGGVLRGQYIYVESGGKSVDELLSVVRGLKTSKVPTVGFCPAEEPKRLECVDALKNFCLELYEYLGGRCVACVIKVYSLIYDEWLVSEERLMKIFELSIKFNLPLYFNNGSIVITTCPSTYEEVVKLPTNAYVDGLRILMEMVKYLQ
jgi:hypothetical protein